MLKGLRLSEGEFAYYEPSDYYMYRQFNIQQFYVLPTQCVYLFCMDLRTNSSYFPIQSVYCATRKLFAAQFTLHNALPWLRHSVTGLSWQRPGFDLRSVFVRFVRGKVAVGQFPPPSISVFPCQYHSTIVPHSSSSTCCSN